MIVDLREGGEELRGQNFALFAPCFPPPYPTMQSCTVAKYSSCVAVNIFYKNNYRHCNQFCNVGVLALFLLLVYLCNILNIGSNAWDPCDKKAMVTFSSKMDIVHLKHLRNCMFFFNYFA